MDVQRPDQAQPEPEQMEFEPKRTPCAPGVAGQYARGLAGAVMGGLLGMGGVFLLLQVLPGLYAIVLPGLLVGEGCALMAGRSPTPLRAAAGAIGVLSGLLTDWAIAPFAADGSLGFYLAHVGHLPRVTLVMIVAGGALAFWSARGRG